MLPNPKNNKNINNLLQKPSESMVDEALANQKKLQNKRKTIIFSLILTTGLSFIFWSFKSIQSLTISPQKISFNFNLKLPKLASWQNDQTNLPSSSSLIKFLEKSSIDWSVFVSLDTDYSKPVFEYHSSNLIIGSDIHQIINKITTTKTSFQSLVNLSLPEGLSFQEMVDDTALIYYQGLVHLPKNKILILIKTSPQPNSSQIPRELPLLIENLYWYAVNYLN